MSRTKSAPAPKSFNPLRPPGPDLVLADLAGVPAAAAAHLAERGVRTLADLRPHLEAAAESDPNSEPAFVALLDLGLLVPDRYRAAEGLVAALGGRVAMLRVLASWPATEPEAGPADFDEGTPPPRLPVPSSVTLQLDDIETEFAAWVRGGRVPPGSELVRFVGSLGSPSGYRAIDGSLYPLERLLTARVVATIRIENQFSATHLVLAPAGGVA